MLRLDVSLLTGRYVATSEADREHHEWPPHPARVFSALVATWADHDETDPNPDQRAALVWLEHQGPPEIWAASLPEGGPRTVVTHYVPVNDTSIIGLAEIERRSNKLDEVDSRLNQRDQLTEAQRRKLEGERAKALDVTAKVAAGAGATTAATAVELLADHRPKQPRHWPSVSPASAIVTFLWPLAEPGDAVVEALDYLASRLVRIGHSSSLVSARFTTAAPHDDSRSRWVPDPDGSTLMRWVQPGQLDALEQRHADHLGARPRTLPKLGVRYRDPEAPHPAPQAPGTSAFSGEWLAFAFAATDRVLPSRRCVEVARAARGALLHHADEPHHPALSGHDDDGSPLIDQPHIAVLPIPFVGGPPRSSRHATGDLVGLAIVIPADVTPSGRSAVLRAAGRWRNAGFELRLGAAGVRRLESGPESLWSLDPGGWRGPSTTWVSATPVALPRHPGALDRGEAGTRARRWAEAQRIVAEACRHIGLPDPVSVEVSRSPLLAGAEPAPRYPSFGQPDRNGRSRDRLLLHTRLVFDTPVEGPVVLGSGRFLGLGLHRPLGEE